ncbi:MAG: CrcB family protein [Rubrivivax sp.]
MNGSFPFGAMLAVAAGSALGGCLRFGVGLWLNPRLSVFPLGTLVVNCVGGLLVGAALVVFERWSAEGWRLFLVIGVLGGLTTFSTFTAESLLMLQRGQGLHAAAHSLAHVFGALGCATLAFWLLRGWLRA